MPENENEDSLLRSRLFSRWRIDDSQRIIDRDCNDEPVWLVSSGFWRDWFAEIEDVMDTPLERRLSYASESHETWRLQQRMITEQLPNPIIGKNKSRLNWINAEWEERGIGKLSSLIGDELIVSGRCISAQASGQVCAIMAIIRNSSLRHLWRDYGPERTLVSLENRGALLPPVIDAKMTWNFLRCGGDRPMEKLENSALNMVDGHLYIDSIKHIFISRDLVLRMAENIALQELIPNSDERTEWNGISSDEGVVWSAMAEATRRVFIAEGEHVLIGDSSHWNNVIEVNLTQYGLGKLCSVKSIGDYGEIQFSLEGGIHPSLCVGILLGCWQRSEGRDGRAKWWQNGHVQMIEITPRRALADPIS